MTSFRNQTAIQRIPVFTELVQINLPLPPFTVQCILVTFFNLGIFLYFIGSPEDGPSRNRQDKKADYETAITSAGFGRFHYWLLFVCGWANASDAVEILCISFVLPAATCDLDLTSEDKVQ